MTVEISEADWQAQFTELGGLLGWRVMHVRRSIGKGKRWTTATSIVGWPDVFCYHPVKGWHFAAELKSEKGKTTPEQDEVLADLRASGVPAYVFRPSDLEDVMIVMTDGPGF